MQAPERVAPHWGRVYSALADALEQGRKQEAQEAQSHALALGDHSSLKERLIRGEDENMRKHQLRYNPDHPEYCHYHAPNMQRTKAEVDAALSELK